MPHFNPHTREGCDRVASSRGSNSLYFNPHTREGCDAHDLPGMRIPHISIHTPVKGVTFHGFPGPQHRHPISIHTPVKGVTAIGQGVVYVGPFQSTHP